MLIPINSPIFCVTVFLSIVATRSSNLSIDQLTLFIFVYRGMYAVVWIGITFDIKYEIQPSLSGESIVNFMWRPTEFKWLKRVSTCSFFNYADNVLYISFLPKGYGNWVPGAISSKYRRDHIVASWSCWLNFSWKEKTPLLSSSSKKKITLFWGLRQVYIRIFSIPVWFIFSVNFLFVT